jgi:hypothetical protein
MDYTPIYVKYNSELRPLISEFEGREEQFEEPLLKEMAYLVDELSLCVQADGSETQKLHFDSALCHLNEAVAHSYKYLVYSHHKRMKKFKRRFSEHQLQLFENGKFVGEFTDESKRAKECFRRTKKLDILSSASNDLKQAYELYSHIEHKISDFESEGAALESRARSIWVTFVKAVVSLAISIGVSYLFSL